MSKILFVLGVVALIVLGHHLYGGGEYAMSLLVESISTLTGIGITVFILDTLAKKRERKALLERLIAQMRSASVDFALHAVDELRYNGWINNGTLSRHSRFYGSNILPTVASLWSLNTPGADYTGANFEEIQIVDSNLSGANFTVANLKGVIFARCDLSGANFSSANLEDCYFNEVDLRRANFRGADLHSAEGFFNVGYKSRIAHLEQVDFSDADLSNVSFSFARLDGARLVNSDLRNTVLLGTHLEGADLTGAKISNTWLSSSISGEPLSAHFDENTILPDGTNWRPSVDWNKFGHVIKEF